MRGKEHQLEDLDHVCLNCFQTLLRFKCVINDQMARVFLSSQSNFCLPPITEGAYDLTLNNRPMGCGQKKLSVCGG